MAPTIRVLYSALGEIGLNVDMNDDSLIMSQVFLRCVSKVSKDCLYVGIA